MYFCFKCDKDLVSFTLLTSHLNDDHVLPNIFLNFTTLRNFKVHIKKMHQCKSVP